MSALFASFAIKDVALKNRIVVAPMCQYRATEGIVGDWHFPHYASLARGGAALVIVEATAVSRIGRITPGCAGLWDDLQIDGMARIAANIKREGAVAGVQIAHAGRKASLSRPWEGDRHLSDAEGGWSTIAPSALAFGGAMPKVPREMTLDDIAAVQRDFAAAAGRAREAGFEWLELHFAHGFLAQTFFNARTNLRRDAYGGDFAGRCRFLVETLAAVRAVWPERLPLSVRFGCTEFDGRDEEWLVDVADLVGRFKDAGADLLNVSIGFSEPNDSIPWGPGMMAPTAALLRRRTELPTGVSWGVEAPRMAEALVANGQTDLVYIAKAFLANPHYTLELARALGVERAAWVLPAPYAHWLERYRVS